VLSSDVAGTRRVRELGHARAPAPTVRGVNRPDSSENVAARARAWTPVPHSSFSRNEGVPGSSPGVGFTVQATFERFLTGGGYPTIGHHEQRIAGASLRLTQRS
jgi:hypothetical protein